MNETLEILIIVFTAIAVGFLLGWLAKELKHSRKGN